MVPLGSLNWKIGTLEAEIFRDKELKRCAVCGQSVSPKSNREILPDCAARVHRRQKTESERKRRVLCGQLGAEKSLIYKASKGQDRSGIRNYRPPRKQASTVHKHDMTNTIYIHQPEKAASFTRLPNFFEAPTFTPLSTKQRCCTPFILRRTDLSRENGWADEYGRIFLYCPINEVVELLRCGRQKAINTLREFVVCRAGGDPEARLGKPNQFTQNPMKRFQMTDFRNPVMERRRTENRNFDEYDNQSLANETGLVYRNTKIKTIYLYSIHSQSYPR